MKTVLKNANLVLPTETRHGDLLIEDDFISKIGGSIDSPGAEEIDCSDKLIIPGVIDAHVHFRSPGYEYKEDWETGSKAALAGGVTTVFDMPNTKPKTTTIDALEQKRGIVGKQSLVNYGLFLGATGENIDVINDAKGIVGVKVYMGQTTGQEIADPDEALDIMLRDLFERTHFDQLLVFLNHLIQYSLMLKMKRKFVKIWKYIKMKIYQKYILLFVTIRLLLQLHGALFI